MNDCKGCQGCSSPAVVIHGVEQPPVWEVEAQDGAFFKQMYLRNAGTIVPQHSHTRAHTTLLTAGKLRAWSDDRLIGDFEAPAAIFIPEKIKHTFLSLVPETTAYCVFAATPVTHEENSLEQSKCHLQ